MIGAMVPSLISNALTYDEAKLCLILQHGNPPGIPLQHLLGLPGHCSGHGKERRALTSAGWEEGWSRSLTPVSPSSHSTISPPGRRSRSGRLPAALALSPSRTQVYNDGVMKIQQISHISSSPPTPFFTAWSGKASERIPLTACCRRTVI